MAKAIREREDWSALSSSGLYSKVMVQFEHSNIGNSYKFIPQGTASTPS